MRNKLKKEILKRSKFIKKYILKLYKIFKDFFCNALQCFIKIMFFAFKYFALPLIFCLFFSLLPIVLEKIITILINNKIISKNLESNYLDFYGTILSGLFTLFGVVITIKYENRNKKKDETITYKPILSVDGIDKNVNCLVREVGLGMGFSSSNFDHNYKEKATIFFNQQRDNNPKYRLIIKNKGRGETFNAVLDDFELTSSNWDKDLNLGSRFGRNQYIGEILKDEYIGIDVHLPNYLFMPEQMEGILWYELRTKTFISYSDMFDRIRYQYCIRTSYKVIIDQYEDEEPYHYKKSGFKYAKVHYEIDSIIPEIRIYSKKKKQFIHEYQYIKEKRKN